MGINSFPSTKNFTISRNLFRLLVCGTDMLVEGNDSMIILTVLNLIKACKTHHFLSFFSHKIHKKKHKTKPKIQQTKNWAPSSPDKILWLSINKI